MSVTLDDVGHRYDEGPWLFRGLSTILVDGGVYALTGPSGSGKSTLLSVLAGWTSPAEGIVTRPEGASVGWIAQNPHGVARRSAIDHVALPLYARGLSEAAVQETAQGLLDDFGLGSRRSAPFGSLSGGEAQRLMFARGIAADPTVLLVDEPTAQLDRVTAGSVDRLISGLAGSSRVVVVATHDQHTRDACTARLDLEDYAR